jgi:hypothetical protein
VWYFFYGTLANSAFLAELFGAAPGSEPVLIPALIQDGIIRTWCRKYNALVDSSGSQEKGWAYKVESKNQEDILRMYETAQYEVVRAKIILQNKSREEYIVQGCTFRFVGLDIELN